jgi:hypothetical protein
MSPTRHERTACRRDATVTVACAWRYGASALMRAGDDRSAARVEGVVTARAGIAHAARP